MIQSRSPQTSMGILRAGFLIAGCLLLTLALSAQDRAAAHNGFVQHIDTQDAVVDYNGTTTWDSHHDTSPPLRELVEQYVPLAIPELHAEPDMPPMPRREAHILPDGALQSHYYLSASREAATIGLNFEGQDFDTTCDCAPPDTNGAVGTTQYVQTVNTVYTIYNKTTGAVVMGPIANNALWSGFTGGDCANDDDGDVTVIFDKQAQRWLIQQFDLGPGFAGPFYDCVAVSTTSDATGSYNRYAFSFGTVNFPDYPKVGAWPSAFTGATQGAYFGSFDIFNDNTGAFTGPMACGFDRNAVLSGTSAAMQCFQLSGNTVNPILPVDVDGTTFPVANEPGYFMTFDNSGTQVDLYTFTPDFPSSSTFTGPTKITVASFTPYYEVAGEGTNCDRTGSGACDIPEDSGDGTEVDSLSDRPMYRLAWHNVSGTEHLNFNHTVAGTSNAAGLRWYDITNPSGTPTVTQQGTFSPDTNARWMGSTAMDQSGDQALGFSQSNASSFPSVFFTGRTPSDAGGTMETQVNIMTGTGAQTGGLTRWGDYSALQVDPSDDCTFWYTQEYIATSGSFNWNTRIANFKFPTCGQIATNFNISASPSTLNITPGGMGTSTITTTISGSFNSAIALSASGQPTGVTVTFNPVSIPAPGSGTSTATISVGSTVADGTYTITVTGAGGSLSHTTTITLNVVSLIPTTTTVRSSQNPSAIGQKVTFTATTSASSGGTPTGTVTFKDGATTLGTGTLSSGVATFSTTNLTPGNHNITAVYGGSSTDSGSTSSVLVQVVQRRL